MEVQVPGLGVVPVELRSCARSDQQVVNVTRGRVELAGFGGVEDHPQPRGRVRELGRFRLGNRARGWLTLAQGRGHGGG